MIEKHSISYACIIGFTTLTMIAFAGNSLLALAALNIPTLMQQDSL